MSTQIFPDFETFCRRKDKNINGVSLVFTLKFPDYKQMNETNIGCWNCAVCEDCTYCRYCYACTFCFNVDKSFKCTHCYNCTLCKHCNDCTNCNKQIGVKHEHHTGI